MTRKPRSDAKLLTLDDAVQMKIFDWLRNMSYDKARLLIQEELSISISTGALHHAWEYWSKRDSENRILKAVTAAEDLTETAAEHLPLITKATMVALQQAAFETVMAGGDEKRVKDYMSIVLKARALDQADQSITLRLRQYEDQVEKTKVALTNAKASGGMTVEAIEAMEEALGLL